MADDNVIDFEEYNKMTAQDMIDNLSENKFAEGMEMALIIYDNETCFYFSTEEDFRKVLYQLDLWKHKHFAGEFDYEE